MFIKRNWLIDWHLQASLNFKSVNFCVSLVMSYWNKTKTRRRSESAYIRQVHIPTIWCQFGDGWCVVGGTRTVEDWTDCAQTHTHTHTHTQKWKQYICQFHSVHLADIIKVSNNYANFDTQQKQFNPLKLSLNSLSWKITVLIQYCGTEKSISIIQ